MNNLNIVVCKGCGDILHSKHRHDFKQCGCPNGTFVDGGNDYQRCGGVNLNLILKPITMAEARRLSQQIKQVDK